MIERVEEISANLEEFRFSYPEVLENRNIEIVDRRQQERIPSNVGFSSGTSLKVTSIRIVRNICNDGSGSDCAATAGYAAQWSHGAAHALGSTWIQNRAISGVVAV